jgi:hypothetical protein
MCNNKIVTVLLKDPGSLSRYRDGLRAEQPGFFPGRSKKLFSLLHSVLTGFGAHPASYPLDTWGSFPVGKAARA